MKGISLRSPQEIQRELVDEFRYDLNEMAKDYGRTPDEMLDLVRNGGKAWRERCRPAGDAFDVTFCPTACVRAAAADPENPTDEEMDAIVAEAAEAIAGDPRTYLAGPNVCRVRLHGSGKIIWIHGSGKIIFDA